MTPVTRAVVALVAELGANPRFEPVTVTVSVAVSRSVSFVLRPVGAVDRVPSRFHR
jgi:hypothetical protein